MKTQGEVKELLQSLSLEAGEEKNSPLQLRKKICGLSVLTEPGVRKPVFTAYT